MRANTWRARKRQMYPRKDIEISVFVLEWPSEKITVRAIKVKR